MVGRRDADVVGDATISRVERTNSDEEHRERTREINGRSDYDSQFSDSIANVVFIVSIFTPFSGHVLALSGNTKPELLILMFW